jgi:hypothetical protein
MPAARQPMASRSAPHSDASPHRSAADPHSHLRRSPKRCKALPGAPAHLQSCPTLPPATSWVDLATVTPVSVSPGWPRCIVSQASPPPVSAALQLPFREQCHRTAKVPSSSTSLYAVSASDTSAEDIGWLVLIVSVVPTAQLTCAIRIRSLDHQSPLLYSGPPVLRLAAFTGTDCPPSRPSLPSGGDFLRLSGGRRFFADASHGTPQAGVRAILAVGRVGSALHVANPGGVRSYPNERSGE